VRVLVGSRDWNYPKFGKFNVATASRQPGSSFKPIVYEKAMEEHLITAATLLKDSPITYDLHPGTYSPHDYDGKYRGPVTVRRALSNSLNIPAVQVVSMLGVPQAVDAARNLGISTLSDPSNYGISIVLGAAEVELLEHTDVYATFANNGVYNKPTLITDITDKSGDVIYSYNPIEKQVLNSAAVYILSSILSDNKARAEEFGNTLTIDRTAAVKTGTTNDYKDAWTMGYTPSLAGGVWVGNNDNTSMDNIAGSLGAAPIWRDLMETFLAGTPNEAFVRPKDVVEVAFCNTKTASSSAGMEFFVEGTQPMNSCTTPSNNVSSLLTPTAPTITNMPTPSYTPPPAGLTTTPTNPSPTSTSTTAPLLPPGELKKLGNH